MTSQQHPARKQLNTLMSQAFRQLRSSIYEGSSLTELNVQQLRTLFLLHIQETTNMSEISNRLGVGLPTVTNLVSKLEEKGLVSREHDTTDRRVVFCSVTERGKAEIEQLWSVRKEQIACRWLSILSVANWSGKMSVDERTDIDHERTNQAAYLERHIG